MVTAVFGEVIFRPPSERRFHCGRGQSWNAMELDGKNGKPALAVVAGLGFVFWWGGHIEDSAARARQGGGGPGV